MRMINAGALKEDLFIKFGNQLPNGLLEEINNAPTVEPAIQKEASWKWQTYTNGFGTFKELCCGECYHKRQQIDLHFCACCGAKMTNADELGGIEAE